MGSSLVIKVGGVGQSCCFWTKFRAGKKCETVLCWAETASTVVARIRREVSSHFHTVAEKRHSNMRDWLFGLSGRILCK
jgi:hypothetical protein